LHGGGGCGIHGFVEGRVVQVGFGILVTGKRLQGAGENWFFAVWRRHTAKNQSKKDICKIAVLLLPQS
jgi:hypothetical protein